MFILRRYMLSKIQFLKKNIVYCSIINSLIGINIILTLLFFLNKQFLNFLSLSWGLWIIYTTVLFAISSYYYWNSYFGQYSKIILYLSGIIYIVISTLVFLFWGCAQVLGLLSFLGGGSLFVIFSITCLIGLGFYTIAGADKYRHPAFYFGIADIIYTIILIKKYIFQTIPILYMKRIEHSILSMGHFAKQDPYSWNTFMGEMTILIIGEVIFWCLFYYEKKTLLRDSNCDADSLNNKLDFYSPIH